MTIIFFVLVALAVAVAGWRELGWSGEAKSPMAELTDAMIAAAGNSVTLAIGLVGVMALFLGLMKVAEEGGLLAVIAKLMRPLMVRLFPDVPADHPAMGAMIMNVSANVVGLGNAATPFGIRAMEALDALNPLKGTATNAMVLFLAINTASVTLLPTSVIALRAAAGSKDPAGILPTTLFATIVATAVAIIAAKLGERWWPADSGTEIKPRDAAALEAFDDAKSPAAVRTVEGGYPEWISYATLLAVIVLIPLTVIYGRVIGPWIVPGLMLGLLAFGLARKVDIYAAFVEGGKDGFTIALRIIPYLVAILVAIGMLRASGALDGIIRPLASLTEPLGLPAEALTMGLLRMLSGSGAFGLLASILNDPAIGPDSYTGYLASTIMGSTETTFYVLAVYFGSVGVKRIRHALVAGLLSDVAGIAASVVAVKLMV
jgi:spore maturation protein SpmA